MVLRQLEQLLLSWGVQEDHPILPLLAAAEVLLATLGMVGTVVLALLLGQTERAEQVEGAAQEDHPMLLVQVEALVFLD